VKSTRATRTLSPSSALAQALEHHRDDGTMSGLYSGTRGLTFASGTGTMLYPDNNSRLNFRFARQQVWATGMVRDLHRF
jgi:hypothetical protein